MNIFNFSFSYKTLVYLTYIFSFLIFFGLWSETIYLSVILDSVRLFIALFIIIRFNPFQKRELTNLDRKIVFHAGLLLFSITTIDSIIENLPFVGSDLQNRLKLISSSKS